MIKRVTRNETLANFYAFTVSDPDTGAILYVGHGKLADIANLNVLARIPDFDNDRPFKVDILEGDRIEYRAQNMAANYLRIFFPDGKLPEFNMKLLGNGHLHNVKCVETGQVWATQTEACEQLGIQPPRMSSHLRRKPGHKTIYGKTYVFTHEPPTDQTKNRSTITPTKGE